MVPTPSPHLKTKTPSRGVSWGGLWGPGPPGVTKGAPKRKKKRGKEREGRKEEKEEKKGKRKKKGKKEGARKLDQYDERGAMQFKVQAGAPGKKTSGAPN